MLLHPHFQITCPAGTPASAPIEVLTTLDPSEPVECRVLVPRGHSYTTGFRLALAHQQVVPDTTGQWVLGDASEHVYDLRGHVNSGAWSFFLYNTDPQHDHFWQVHFKVEPLRRVRHTRVRGVVDPTKIYAAGAR